MTISFTASGKLPLANTSVGIDGMNLALRRGTGVSTYARSLSLALSELGATVDVLYGMRMSGRLNSLLKEVMFFDLLGGEPFRKAKWMSVLSAEVLERFRSLGGYQAFNIPLTGRVVSNSFQARMPHYDRLLNIDDLFLKARRHYQRYRRFLDVRIPYPPKVMHWTYPLPIRLVGAINIYTIHDLVPLRLPYTTLDNKRYYYRLIRDCLIHGDLICTVSECSKRDIQNIFPDFPAKQIVNTYEAVSIPSKLLKKTEDTIASEIKSTFNLTYKDYFLFFGAIEPKKNIGRLIEAFLYSKTISPLVIVGSKAWKSEQELELLNDTTPDKRSEPTDLRIRRLEYVPFSLLVSLIRGAKALVWPSLYEGFGLPVLEAMLLGTPVLTSTTGSLPEVAGDAALMVDPYDIAAISTSIEMLDQDSGLRDDLITRGRSQAQKFSMERYQEDLGRMYAGLLHS